MINTAFTTDSPYFNHLRPELINLAVGTPYRVLDIGCATGKLLGHFKKKGAKFTAGVELVPEVAAMAQNSGDVDVVVCGNIENVELPFQTNTFDLIVAGHVLEHVTDPWQTTAKLLSLLKPGGQFIGSLPNIRCLTVTLPLILKGHWRYTDEGILDRTHLRFFTKEGIEDLLTNSGLSIDCIVGQVSDSGKISYLNTITGGLLIDHCAYTYNFSAIKLSK